MKDLHTHIKLQIEKKVGKYAETTNQRCKALIFEPGDWVWLHLKSKLMPRGDGPFQVIKRINDNAYEFDMPNTYLGSNSFNVTDLTSFDAGFPNLWTNSFQPGEYDGNQVEKAQAHDAEAQEGAQAQRITMSMARALGQECQMMTLLISIV